MPRSRTSTPKNTRYTTHHTQLRQAVRKLFPAVGLPLCSDDIRLRWTDRLLAIALLLLAWNDAATLREAFNTTREVIVFMYPSRRRPGNGFEGFVKAWRTRGAALLTRLAAALRIRTEKIAGKHWRWKRWVVLAVDGSRINCPRTQANEKAFGCAGKRRTAPQQLLVTLLHVVTELPWSWRRARGDAGERSLLREMLGDLPKQTLLLADAGFVGYDLLRELLAAGHSFIVRVGGNVTLLRKLGYFVRESRGLVYLWPTHRRGSGRPLVLRLVQLRDAKGKRVALLTDVLDASLLSDAEVASWYRRRWSIEVMHRTLKQTLGRSAVRAETPALARCELDWAMVGLWMLGLLAVERTGVKRGWSPAKALQVVRAALRGGRGRVGSRWLDRELRAARRDVYVRRGKKTARDWPHKKSDRPPGMPTIRMATASEKAAAQRIRQQTAAA